MNNLLRTTYSILRKRAVFPYGKYSSHSKGNLLLQKSPTFLISGSKGFQLLYYSFDRLSGTTILDDSGNNVDGTASSEAQVMKEDGKCGKGLHLNQGVLKSVIV